MILKLVVPVVETTCLPFRSARAFTGVPAFTGKRVPV